MGLVVANEIIAPHGGYLNNIQHTVQGIVDFLEKENKKITQSEQGVRTGLSVAEKQGFEPWLRFSRTTPLAGEPLRPLGYFSEYKFLY